jgi:hypothetical protein
VAMMEDIDLTSGLVFELYDGRTSLLQMADVSKIFRWWWGFDLITEACS